MTFSYTSYTNSFKNTSILFGVFFCVLTSTYGEKTQTPDWHQKDQGERVEPAQKNSGPQRKSEPKLKKSVESNDVRFLSYNLKNYLTMKRYADGKAHDSQKPESEIAQVIHIIESAQPDILGVCEIGTDKDLKNLQDRLKKAGVDLPHSHRTYGGDSVRALAILSRYPILSWALPKQMSYQLEGRPFKISRGILDVTIQLPDKKVRFLGVHLKSKRPSEQADQELMRRNESMLLRKHINIILNAHPETLLIAYGDFNDTKRAKAIYTIKGRSHSKNHMEMLELKDSRGENWTHNWKREDIYSRFDYVMANKNLAPLINRKASRILDPENWDQASDHRALLLIIK